MPKIINKDKNKAKQVENLSGLGLTHEQIANFIDLSRNTLVKYYSQELLKGKAKANAQVSSNLFRIATGDGNGAVTAAIFWLKCQAFWKDTMNIEVTHADTDQVKYRRLVSDIREFKLAGKESDDSTH